MGTSSTVLRVLRVEHELARSWATTGPIRSYSSSCSLEAALSGICHHVKRYMRAKKKKGKMHARMQKRRQENPNLSMRKIGRVGNESNLTVVLVGSRTGMAGARD